MKTIKFLTFALLAATLLYPVSPVRADDTPQVKIQYTKWITTYPAMAGEVSGDIVGDFAGVILKRDVIAGGNIVKLEASYEIIAGAQSFVAIIQGTEIIQTQHAVLNGEIVSGWLAGAQVHVEFDINHDSVKCEGHPTCFIGEITIMTGSAD